ncbi:MAG: hypothetical protein J6S00_03455, partial [Clostridia bacterium]|nr:hypothetical protein [Clostridia bacterium]
YDVDMDLTAQGLRHCIIGGYHFFGINLNSVGVQPYTQETYDWLKVEFDKILSKDKNATIFLAAHFGPETSNKYKKEGEFGLKELLNDYPQVITFYGHDHDFIQKETSIMQYESGFIALNCGSANYFPLKHPAEDLEYVNVTKNFVEQFFGGYLVQIDGDGDIRVRRINFKTGTKCADDWIIPAAKNGKRELNYTMDRAKTVEKPYFEKGTELLLKQTAYNLQVGFDAAICEDYVYYYKVEIYKKGSQDIYKQFAISSRLFADKSKDEAAKRFDIYVDPLEKGEYTIKVIPYDTFSSAGKGIEGNLTVA